MASARQRLASVPPDHDALGHPNLRDQQGPGDGQTSFQQISPSSSNADVTKQSPTLRRGDIKYGGSI